MEVTEIALKDWLDHPVTKAYLEALDQHNLTWQNAGATAAPSITADQTHAAVAKREGILIGIQQACRPVDLMNQYGLVLLDDDEEEAAA